LQRPGFFISNRLKIKKMTGKVRIVADQNGNIIGVSQNNPEYGYVRVEQIGSNINQQGWLRKSKRSALIKGTVQDLLDANFTSGQELPGRIVVIESHTPFNPQNPERDLKIAGDTGVICRVNDQPIYRQSFYTPSDDAQDELIMHTNTDEIRDVQNAARTLSVLNKKDLQELANL
jgi:hypothetical protein